MKILNGLELAGFIKERQAKELNTLVGKHGSKPKLAIIQCVDDPVINTYVRLKKAYGSDIGADVEVHNVKQAEVEQTINKLNTDNSSHGLIVQLPLEDETQTDKIVNMVVAEKDVDALGTAAKFEPATPMAILWLLAGYNIDLRNKKVLLVGKGKLVGAPLERILKSSEVEVEAIDRTATNLSRHSKDADIIITATGSPAILYSEMIKEGAVVVDAGVASESGKTVGDLHEDVYKREDLTITPKKGGVGPLTVCALFENLLRAYRENQNG